MQNTRVAVDPGNLLTDFNTGHSQSPSDGILKKSVAIVPSRLESGYTIKYCLSPREIPRAPPLGFPSGSGNISSSQYSYNMFNVNFHKKKYCQTCSISADIFLTANADRRAVSFTLAE